VIFVEGVVPGDVVDILVEKDKKSYAEARLWNMIEKSPLRVPTFCKHFGNCGGCKWQDLEYTQQLVFKQKQVNDALQRIGKVELPEIDTILPSAETKFYRNKLEYTFSERRWLTKEEMEDESISMSNALGYHVPRVFDKILDIQECFLQAEPSNSIRNEIKEYAKEHALGFFNVRDLKGYLRIITIRTTTRGEVMIILQVAEDREEDTKGLLNHLIKKFPQISSCFYVLNQKGNDTLHDLEPVLHHGLPYITEVMEGLQFRIGPKSFYQTNANQAYELYKITRDFAGLTGNELVYDLYTGTGTIAQFVAKDAHKVVGIEYVEMAIADAKINAELNGVNNCSFFAGDMKNVLTADFVEQHGKPDVIITDPPRAGMHTDVIARMLEIGAEKIVYVSCNPATQARDLQLLDAIYEVKRVQPVDMFPHTHYVENVVLLQKRG
jgi:23S rRNA (uracil1939-C5)-methyltransferase